MSKFVITVGLFLGLLVAISAADRTGARAQPVHAAAVGSVGCDCCDCCGATVPTTGASQGHACGSTPDATTVRSGQVVGCGQTCPIRQT